MIVSIYNLYKKYYGFISFFFFFLHRFIDELTIEMINDLFLIILIIKVKMIFI